MSLDNVFRICDPDKKWTIEEANDILPLLRYISTKCDTEVNRHLSQQRFLLKAKAPQALIEELDKAVQQELVKWGNKLVKLGLKYHNGYILFNTGLGYWSWQTTEPKVEYFSYYSEPIINRAKYYVTT